MNTNTMKATWWVRAALLVGGGLAGGLIGASAQEGTGDVEIIVRTQVTEGKRAAKPGGDSLQQAAAEHGKAYVLLLAEQPKSIYKLVNPVDPQAIADEVSKQLDAHGFHRVAPGAKPDIVITVKFGRGMMPNPYYDDTSAIDDTMPDPGNWIDPASAPQITVTSPKLAQRLAVAGVSGKATKAQYEKLFVTVRAWKYPSSPQEKPEVLWIAAMNVDDPDHRDLNTFYKAMIAAGAPYFDRRLDEEEVSVRRPLRNGHVEIGEQVEVAREPEKK
ncbi:DUF4136 domain-containing protein [Horticoccus luteus]|uniref:DUF4136 domain-containing protein n=1 Tax=Horticoccus luteus TaxID=2862869 RepID=A0A8F9XM31_9BACT|nr:DUF4136 domain-containing protein [Horticoccus luteus]QYM79629.1 DUF4136 domain-containing protein [Horticoccus luteus]